MLLSSRGATFQPLTQRRTRCYYIIKIEAIGVTMKRTILSKIDWHNWLIKGCVPKFILVLAILMSDSLVRAQQAFTTDCAFGIKDIYTTGEQVCVTGNFTAKPPGLIFPEGKICVIPTGYANSLADITPGGCNLGQGLGLGGAFYELSVWLPQLTPGSYDLYIDQYPYGITGGSDLRVTNAFRVLDVKTLSTIDILAVKKAARSSQDAFEAAVGMTKVISVLDSLVTLNDFAGAFGFYGGLVGVNLGIISWFSLADIATSYDSAVILVGNKIITAIATSAAERYKGIADDPPDPDFLRLVALKLNLPSAATNLNPRATHAIARGQIAIAQALSVHSAALQALLPTIEKLQGAQKADHNYGKMLQAEQASMYISIAQASAARVLTELALYEEALRLGGGLTRSADVNLVRADQVRAATQGFTDQENAIFSSYGLSTAQISAVKEYYINLLIPDRLDQATFIDFMRQGISDSQAQLVALANQVAQIYTENKSVTLRLVPAASVPSTTGNAGMPVSLTASATHFDSSLVLLYEWDLDGDGNFTDATGQTTSFIPPYPGLHAIGVRVSASAGTFDYAYGLVTAAATNGPPEIISFAPADPAPFLNVGATAHFSVRAVDPDGDMLTVTWLVDNVVKATGELFSYTMPDENPHTVVARVSDTSALTPDAQQVFVIRAAKWESIIKAMPSPQGENSPTVEQSGCSSAGTRSVPVSWALLIPLLLLLRRRLQGWA